MIVFLVTHFMIMILGTFMSSYSSHSYDVSPHKIKVPQPPMNLRFFTEGNSLLKNFLEAIV